ncbi:hypothetical protein F5X99DRAFT_369532 [Biscogniauxia marginata]|nr:hypothetical protein F5X99DRAFT_369532 [Biscogniauxia marginata]
MGFAGAKCFRPWSFSLFSLSLFPNLTRISREPAHMDSLGSLAAKYKDPKSKILRSFSLLRHLPLWGLSYSISFQFSLPWVW